MIRVMLDANVIVSGILHYEANSTRPAIILNHAMEHSFEVAVSDHLLAEVERTLLKPYFSQRVDPLVGNDFLAFLRLQRPVPIEPGLVTGVASHPANDLILATALTAAADVLVTGDRMLLKLGSHEGVAIMSPSDFLALLESQE